MDDFYLGIVEHTLPLTVQLYNTFYTYVYIVFWDIPWDNPVFFGFLRGTQLVSIFIPGNPEFSFFLPGNPELRTPLIDRQLFR